MRVCLVGPYPPQIGGVATHVAELRDTLIEQENSIWVLTWGNRSRKSDIIGVPILNMPLIRSVDFFILGLCYLLYVSKRYKIQLIHGHYIFPFGTLTVIAGKICRIPVIITAHGSDILLLTKNTFYQKIIKWTLKSANHIILISNALIPNIINMHIEKSKISVIPPGIQLKKFTKVYSKLASRKKLNIPLNSKIMLYIGRLSPPKRIDDAIYALIDVLNKIPDVYFLIVGEGKLKFKLKNLAKQLKIEDRIFFYGSVQFHEVQHFYNSCDVVVLPSDSEGFPLSILEAMASKRPIIASNVGGIKEIIMDRVNGFLVEPNNINDLSIKIIEVLNYSSNVDSIIEKGCETVLTYSWNNLVKNIEYLYISILKNFNKIKK